jgi:hypothetical protein
VRDALEQLSRHPAGDGVDPLVASVRGLAVAADATELEADQIAGIVRDYPDAARAIAAASTAQDMVHVATSSFRGKDAGEGRTWDEPRSGAPGARALGVAASRCVTRAIGAARAGLRRALQSEAWRASPDAREALVQLAAAAGADDHVLAVIEVAPSAARCLLERGVGEVAAWRCGRLAGAAVGRRSGDGALTAPERAARGGCAQLCRTRSSS